MGAGGCIPVCANFIPKPFVEIWKAHTQEGAGELHILQDEINAVRETLLLGDRNWLAGISYGMSTLGIGGANVISPLQPLGESEKVSVDGLKAQYAEYLAGLSG